MHNGFVLQTRCCRKARSQSGATAAVTTTRKHASPDDRFIGRCVSAQHAHVCSSIELYVQSLNPRAIAFEVTDTRTVINVGRWTCRSSARHHGRRGFRSWHRLQRLARDHVVTTPENSTFCRDRRRPLLGRCKRFFSCCCCCCCLRDSWA